MKRTFLLMFWQLCLLPGANAFDDVVNLKDGRGSISGLVESAAKDEIHMKIGDNPHVLFVDQIQSIQFGSSVPQGISLPGGTEIAVRTIDPIDSGNADDRSHDYAASLDDPIVVNGVTVIPMNAKAILRVTELKKPGRLNPLGRVSLSTSLVAVIVNDQRVEVKAGDVDSQSGTRAKSTAVGAGVGAGVGAAVGAGVGGPIGAAVGAGAGAVMGAGAGVLKGAQPVKITPETRFTYKLAQPAVISLPDGPVVSAQADTLTLRAGTSVTGSWVSIDADKITFRADNQDRTFPRSEVSKLTFGPPVPQVKLALSPAPPPAPDRLPDIPPPPPPPDQPAAAVTLGMTIDQVVAIFGQPDTISEAGATTTYKYKKKNLKVIFTDKKVTDVQ